MENKRESLYLTLAEAAAEFNTEERTLYRQIKAGTLPGYKPFGKIMVKRSDLIALFQRSKVKSA